MNLSKSAFGHAQIQSLGHVVGGGEVKPITAKVDAINNFPVPGNKTELMRYDWVLQAFLQEFLHNCRASYKP